MTPLIETASDTWSPRLLDDAANDLDGVSFPAFDPPTNTSNAVRTPVSIDSSSLGVLVRGAIFITPNRRKVSAE